jgi:hypothetical protein
LTWFNISSSKSPFADPEYPTGGDTYLGHKTLNKYQYWRVDGDCNGTLPGTIKEASQAWGPMSYVIYNKDIDTTCYLIKADPLDKGTPSGTYDGS